jgi:hypothetical protein
MTKVKLRAGTCTTPDVGAQPKQRGGPVIENLRTRRRTKTCEGTTHEWRMLFWRAFADLPAGIWRLPQASKGAACGTPPLL